MKHRIVSGLICAMALGLAANASYAKQSNRPLIPEYVTNVPPDHFAGISPPEDTIDLARKFAVLDVARQVLGAIGMDYHYQFADLVSGSPYNPAHRIEEKLSCTAHGLVIGLEQNIAKSSWIRNEAGRYICFVLIKYTARQVRTMRRLSKKAWVVASLISNAHGKLRLKVAELNGVAVTLSHADIIILKKNRFEPFISFCIWKVPAGSESRFRRAIAPIRICESTAEISLQTKAASFKIEDYLLGVKIYGVAVLKGRDELGRAVGTKIEF